MQMRMRLNHSYAVHEANTSDPFENHVIEQSRFYYNKEVIRCMNEQEDNNRMCCCFLFLVPHLINQNDGEFT